MISRRILAAVALFCAIVSPAHAQKTKAAINTEIVGQFPDNNVNLITPLNLRTVTTDIVNSIMPTAPVVSGNIACFSGTTGLLQDCGSAPTASITALTGDVTTAAGPGSVAATLATVNTNTGSWGTVTQAPQFTVNGKGLITAAANVTVTPAVGSITGFGTGVGTALGVNVGTAGAPVVNGGALGTPSSGTLTNATGLPTTGLTGTLQAGQFPALTGDVTTISGALATTVAPNVVTFAKIQQVASSSLVGNATGLLANATGITLGATLAFSASALQTAAMTGDVTTSANSFAATIAANAVTNSKMATMPAFTIKGNATGAGAVPTDISIPALTQKVSPAAGDFVMIADSAASNSLKYALVSAISSAGSVSSIAGNTGAFTLGNGIDNNVNQIQLTAARRTLPTVQTFTASATYTPAANVLWVRVKIWGPGGGGAGSGASGGNGGNGSAASALSGANCGTLSAGAGGGGTFSSQTGGTGGTSTGGNVLNVTGQVGGGLNGVNTVFAPGGIGGNSPVLGGGGGTSTTTGSPGTANTGGGGAGGGTNSAVNGQPGGGGAGYVEHIINGTMPASCTLVIGTGGAAGAIGTSGAAGGAGATGRAIFEEYYGT